jgi:hypothetical protein
MVSGCINLAGGIKSASQTVEFLVLSETEKFLTDWMTEIWHCVINYLIDVLTYFTTKTNRLSWLS